MSKSTRRKAFEDFTLKQMSILDPTGVNTEYYRDKFDRMSDAEFDTYVSQLRSGERRQAIRATNMVNALRQQNINASLVALGLTAVDVHLRIYDDATGRTYTPRHTSPIFLLPVRRVKQYLNDKRSVAMNDTKTDLYSGQVAGDDKASSVSLVQAQTIYQHGLDKSLDELFNTRGGNTENYAVLRASLEETGSASLTDLDPRNRPRAVEVAKTYYRAMHLDNNL